MPFKIEHIPPLTSVALSVIRFNTDSPDADIKAMERIISPDKGICSELLKIANSALYGRSGKIKTIREAITLLGVKTVKNMVLMLSTMHMIGKLKKPIYHSYLLEFPVLTALVSLDISYQLNLSQLKEDAFLLSLLHKIGMSVLAINKPNDYHDLLGEVMNNQRDLVTLERENYETDHNELTLQVFDEWKLPSDMKTSIEGLQGGLDTIGSVDDITRLTGIAAIIARRLLDLPPATDDAEMERTILEHYGKTTDAMAIFNEEYMEQIREHPFFLFARSG